MPKEETSSVASPEQKLWTDFIESCKEKGYEVELLIQFQPEVFDGMRSKEKQLFSAIAQGYFKPNVVFRKIEAVEQKEAPSENQKEVPVEPVDE